jgi:maleate isomerase
VAAQRRLGVIVPSVNTVVETWYPAVLPEGVSVHFSRMLIPDATSPDKIVEMDQRDGMRAIRQIASCRPHAVAYGCTASSVVQGPAYDEELRREIGRIAAVPATTAAHSILTACRRLGMHRVTAISPYPETVDEAEHRFFARYGIETIAAWDPSADGIVVACLNVRSHLAIEAIEAKIRKPVVTSTQATLWHLLRLAGIPSPIPGCGRLLREA